MEDIRIYDFSLNLLAIENKIISSNWSIYFNDIGKAEIHLPLSAKSVPVLFENKYLVIVQGKKHAIITAKQIGSECIIYGKTPNWILSKKVLLPFDKKTKHVETACRDLVESSFSDAEEFVLGNECGLDGEGEFFQESASVLSDVIKNSLSTLGAGHRVYFDIPNRKWVFEVIKGIPRCAEISKSSLTAYDMKYLCDLQDYSTSGYFRKEEKDENGNPIWDEIQTEETNGLYRWETRLISNQTTDAISQMGEAKIKEEISSCVKRLVWGIDYDLGDTLSVKFECGDLKVKKTMKIIGISLWEESEDTGAEPIFELI